MSDYRQQVPDTEVEARIRGLQARMQKAGLDGALIVQKADLFYYAGTTQNGWLYVPADKRPVFMVFKDLERARAESGLETVLPLISPKKIPDTLNGLGVALPERLGLEMDVMPANIFLMFQEIFRQARIKDISLMIRMQRAVKSEFEISCITRAAELADQVAAQVPDLVREGMTEVAFAGLLEARARALGHQGLIRMRMWDNILFYGHIMCGPGAAVPGAFASPTSGAGMNPSIGQGPSMNRVRPGQPLLVDYVFALDGYLADHTRIFSIGPLDDQWHKAHNAMLTIQDRIKEIAVPGIGTGELYDTMITMARELGYADPFMGGAAPKIRFTGHGLGIELDEFPFIAQGQELALAKGMVIALEPKAVFPGKGVVGIENTFVVARNGLEALTRYPDGIQEI